MSIRRTSILYNIALASTLLLVTSACASGDTGGGDSGSPSVVLGALLPMTGDLASLGQNASNAVELAVKQASEAAGSTATVKLVSRDSGTEESLAQSAIQELLGQNIDALVGEISLCQSVIDNVVQNGVLMIAPACTTPQLSTYDDNGLFFRTAAPSDVQGKLLAEVAYEDGKRKAAVITVSDSYGQFINERFVKRFEELGGEVVANVQYDPNGRSFTAETQQLASANPDMVLMVGYEDMDTKTLAQPSCMTLLKEACSTCSGTRETEFRTHLSQRAPTPTIRRRFTSGRVSELGRPTPRERRRSRRATSPSTTSYRHPSPQRLTTLHG